MAHENYQAEEEKEVTVELSPEAKWLREKDAEVMKMFEHVVNQVLGLQDEYLAHSGDYSRPKDIQISPEQQAQENKVWDHFETINGVSHAIREALEEMKKWR